MQDLRVTERMKKTRETVGKVVSSKERRGKKARVEDAAIDGRHGVNWRSPGCCVVEMRLPKKIALFKLHFGEYGSGDEAMVARDFGAFVRDSTGEKDRDKVGGFHDVSAHPSIFDFEESRPIFESMEDSKLLCEEYQGLLEESKRLLEVHTKEDSKPLCEEYKKLLKVHTKSRKKFCDSARKFIHSAIPLFRLRHPQRFADSRQPKRLPTSDPVDNDETHRNSLPSTSRIRVSPIRPNTRDGSSASVIGASSVEIKISLNGFPFQRLLLMNVPLLTDEEILAIVRAKIDSIQCKIVDKLLEDLPDCTVAAETIPALD